MGKKPFTSTSPIESIVDLTTSSANCVPPSSPSATSELSISAKSPNVLAVNFEKFAGARKKDSPVWYFFK
ncbi:hypothetical protein RvY_02789 [Ramazzottius varieornatus]|uniref:Uncharacterized protein n=1 Tax=Ramazzottius varieornatus TaxID=947166 RepID=A0A1D1UPP4_RAMVA|nr:hypothetical protein RvY_02789 [Ramazzottius varieornatus]